MASATSDSGKYCTFERYVHGWMVGTGLKVSLAPGRYLITADEQIDGRTYLQLEKTYRIDAAMQFD